VLDSDRTENHIRFTIEAWVPPEQHHVRVHSLVTVHGLTCLISQPTQIDFLSSLFLFYNWSKFNKSDYKYKNNVGAFAPASRLQGTKRIAK
jgi:hypothetical protein